MKCWRHYHKKERVFKKYKKRCRKMHCFPHWDDQFSSFFCYASVFDLPDIMCAPRYSLENRDVSAEQVQEFLLMSGGSRYSKEHWFYSALSVLQAQLVSRNMDKSITHQALVQLSEVFQLFHMRPHSLPWKWKCNTVCLEGLKVSSYFSLYRKSPSWKKK